MKDSTTPTNKINLLTKAARGTLRQFRPPREGARKRPQMALPYQDASWFVLVNLDSAAGVSAPTGTSAAWYQRDPKLFRSLGWRSAGRAPAAAPALARAGRRIPGRGG